VLPYANDDPVLARRLQDAGAAAVMPLARRSARGSASGTRTTSRSSLRASPSPSSSTPAWHRLRRRRRDGARLRRRAHEHGHRRLQGPGGDATAMRLAVERTARVQGGRIPKKLYATASSPLEGVPIGRPEPLPRHRPRCDPRRDLVAWSPRVRGGRPPPGPSAGEGSVPRRAQSAHPGPRAHIAASGVALRPNRKGVNAFQRSTIGRAGK